MCLFVHFLLYQFARIISKFSSLNLLLLSKHKGLKILKGPVKLIYLWLLKNFSKTTSKSGEIGRFNRSLLIESF